MTDHLLTVAGTFIRTHAAEAARVLEGCPQDELAAFLAAVPADLGAMLLDTMEVSSAARGLDHIAPERAAALIASVPQPRAVALMRGMAEGARGRALRALPSDSRDHLERVLSLRAYTVGAYMDPRVLTLPPETTVAGAIALVRGAPEHAAHILYVVDRLHRLAGVVSLKGLLAGEADEPVASLMVRRVVSLRVRDSLASVQVDPSWLKYRMLPVLDEHGMFAGVLRHYTLREVQDRENRSGNPSTRASAALGDLYRIGLAAMFSSAIDGAEPSDAVRAAPRAAVRSLPDRDAARDETDE